VAGYQSREAVEDERYRTVHSLGSRFADACSDYEVEVAVSDPLAASDVVVIAIRRHAQLGMVDDILVTPDSNRQPTESLPARGSSSID
jgi:hypothetical protein